MSARGEQLPERVVLQCDAPDCVGEGEWCEVMTGGRRSEMILCVDHRAPLVTVAGWGRPVKAPRPPARRSRDTSPGRLRALIREDDD